MKYIQTAVTLVALATVFELNQIEAALGGLPPASKHASVLAADALKHLVAKLEQR